MHEVRHIAYRGFLRSCNYHCTYCPFSKKRAAPGELDKDAAALKRFADKISQLQSSPLTVQILPYGEALIHAYYWVQLARISCLEQVGAVGCQTNLSFAVREQLTLFRQGGGDVRKLRLWCTFHPTMTSIDDFAAQCAALKQEQLRFSVGVVGDPAYLTTIVRLRQTLPQDVYLWINRMEGLGRSYTAAETAAFTEIDPFFFLEMQEPAADAALCSGGRSSLFVRGDGSCYSCNLSHRKLGNFYNDDWQNQMMHCSVRRCSCYLAYALRQDLAALTLFDQHPSFRLPILFQGVHRPLQAIFIDVDGTLLNAQGSLRPRLRQCFTGLAQHYTLYLATQRPQKSALQLLGADKLHFSGGVFADGAYIRAAWDQPPCIAPLTLDNNTLTALEAVAKRRHLLLRLYHERNMLYKVTLQSRTGHAITDAVLAEFRAIIDQALVSRDGTTVSAVSQQAGKWQGMLALAQTAGFGPANMAYMGNAACDADIFQKVSLSVTFADGAPEALAAADYVLADW